MKLSPRGWAWVGAILVLLVIALVFTPFGEWLAATPFIAGADYKGRLSPLTRHTAREIGFFCYDNGSQFCEKEGFVKPIGVFDPEDPLSTNGALVAYLLRQPPDDREYVEIVSCAKGHLKNFNTNLGWQYSVSAKENIPDWCKKPFTLGYALKARDFDSVPLYICRHKGDSEHALLTVDERRCLDTVQDLSNVEDKSEFEPELLGYGFPSGVELCYQVVASCTDKPGNQVCKDVAPFCLELAEGQDEDEGTGDAGSGQCGYDVCADQGKATPACLAPVVLVDCKDEKCNVGSCVDDAQGTGGDGTQANNPNNDGPQQCLENYTLTCAPCVAGAKDCPCTCVPTKPSNQPAVDQPAANRPADNANIKP